MKPKPAMPKNNPTALPPLGRGDALSVNRIAELIGGPRIHVAPRAGEPRDTLADLTRSRAILGWTPEVETEAGVRELVGLHGI